VEGMRVGGRRIVSVPPSLADHAQVDVLRLMNDPGVVYASSTAIRDAMALLQKAQTRSRGQASSTMPHLPAGKVLLFDVELLGVQQ